MDDGSTIPEPRKHIVSSVGLDMGIHDFVTTSDGEKVANLRFLKRGLKNLKRKQQSLSRKQKGSNGRAKAKLLVAKVHERVSNARNDFQHKLSRNIIVENQAVIVETLKTANMMKNKRLARHIGDAAWSGFVAKLAYKAEASGVHLILHLARELARIWGNLDYTVRELRRDDESGESEVLAGQIHEAVWRAWNTPAVRERLLAAGFDPVADKTLAQQRDELKAQSSFNQGIVQRVGIKLE